MSWLGALGMATGLALRNILGEAPNPNKVLDVKSGEYSNRFIHCREEALVLYGTTKEGISTQQKYEIVLHRPCSETLHQAFSLFRSNELVEAEIRFLQLKDKIPLLVGISREVCNLGGIQKLCDALQENPTWTVAHLASFFALHGAFQHPDVLSHLNSPDVTGVSPLQVAIKMSNLRTVQVLLSAKASLEHLDKEGNSVFHYAAPTTKEIILVLTAEPSKYLNCRNSDGYTPLHLSCLADKPECVKALIVAGADVNITASQTSVHSSSSSTTPSSYLGEFVHENTKNLHAEDMKFGGTPLHWSRSRQVIETLVDLECDINSCNFGGRTALHIMVLRNRLECVVALLSRDADVNIGDHDGNTPLHLAVTQGSAAIVQALVIFGADLTYKNHAGATPRHGIRPESGGDKILYILHSVGAPRCSLAMQGCTRGCEGSSDDYNGVPPPAPPSSESREIVTQMLSVVGMDIATTSVMAGKKSTKGGRLLCLDGGGIRGLILVVILLELEKELGCPVIHCFDWVAGTSTGGILTLGLAAGKTLKECLCLYFRMKEHAFVGRRPYSSEPLEGFLKEALGTESVMADIKHPKLVITGVLADRKPVDLHLFRNYESPSSVLGIGQLGMFKPTFGPEEQLVWRVARATGAAPSYFRTFGRFLDGGLIANNPTLDTMTEIHEYNLALKASGRSSEVCPLTAVVSLGTGLIPVTQVSEIDVFRPDSLWDAARLAIGISNLGALLVDQATASNGRVVDRARAWCSMAGVPYYRFNPQLSEDIAMDEKDDEKLVNMLWEARVYMHSSRSIVKEVARLLTKEEQ